MHWLPQDANARAHTDPKIIIKQHVNEKPLQATLHLAGGMSKGREQQGRERCVQCSAGGLGRGPAAGLGTLQPFRSKRGGQLPAPQRAAWAACPLPTQAR